MKVITWRRFLIVALCTGALVAGVGVYAAVNQTIADGTYAYFEEFDGPASTRMRTLTIAPGEILGWHNHPGVGAYTIVKQGTLTVEDGCGFDTTYYQGDAFLEPAGRVHRGKNLGTQPVITAQMFITPVGTPFTIDVPARACGRPLVVEECKEGGWQQFDYPRPFQNQGECIKSVIVGN